MDAPLTLIAEISIKLKLAVHPISSVFLALSADIKFSDIGRCV